MTEFRLDRADVSTLIWHTALYGLASILEEAGHDGLRVYWSKGMQPRGVVSAAGIDPQSVGEAVRQHAEARTAPGSWTSQNHAIGGKSRGLMSPRIARLDDIWPEFRIARYHTIDAEMADRRWADLRMIHALGEPAYWSRDRSGKIQQDDGASRLEMQPRNQGSEFVRNRLQKLAAIITERSLDSIRDGLTGAAFLDELGTNSPTSSTPTGLSNVGPTDNAVAWCALWGLASFPSSPQVGGMSSRGITRTVGHLGGRRAEWFYTPVWHQRWTTARLRAVLVSKQLADVSSRGLDLHSRDSRTASDMAAGEAWLRSRGVVGVARFPIHEYGSSSAPERRALGADLLPLTS